MNPPVKKTTNTEPVVNTSDFMLDLTILISIALLIGMWSAQVHAESFIATVVGVIQ